MLKNAYFLEKDVNNRLNVGGFAPEPLLATGGWELCPQTPALLLPPTITTLSSSFLALKCGLLPSKKKTIFAPIFHFKLCGFC